MTDQQHVELFEALGELRRCYPEWRFGQSIANLAGWANQDVWDVEDEQLLAVAREHLKSLREEAAST
jgi:hypothetical protein